MQLAEQGFRVLLTCFNRPLADHLKRQLAGCDGLDVFAFHQLCVEFARRAGLPLSTSPEPSADFFDRELPEAFLSALERLPDRYDAIVVDEGQDFTGDFWLTLSCALKDPDHSILYIFYDDNQDLFRPPALPDNFPQSFPLVENYRNTSQIHSVAKSFYWRPDEMVASGPEGEPVQFVAVRQEADIGAEVESTLRVLLDMKVAPSNIAILTGRAVESSRFASLRSLGPVPLTRDAEREPERVLVESVFRFKGLERQVVVLTDIETLDPSHDQAAYYVALTRARLLLVVVGTRGAVSRLKDFVATRKTAVAR
jgi:superfamily I DNA/RNA helicase